MSCFYAAGMTLNDVFDQHWDAQSQPYRPILSGRISARGATIWGVGLLVVGFEFLALALRAEGVLVGLAFAGVIVLYDWVHKRHWCAVLLMAFSLIGDSLVT